MPIQEPPLPRTPRTRKKTRNVKDLQDAVRNGQRFQVRFAQSRQWRRYKEYYRHHFAKGTLPVNTIFSIMRSLVAQVYIKQPSVTITPTKPGLIHFINAKTNESIARYLLRERQTKRQLKRMIQDVFLMGTASMFHGYDSEYGYDAKETVGGAPVSLTHFDKRGYRIEYDSFVNPGMPWAIRARPDDVVFPWGTENANNAEWVALRKLRPLEDLKKDVKYTVPQDMTGTYVQLRTGPEGERPNAEPFFQELMEKQQWVELWQVHDLKTGKIYAFDMNSDKFLREDVDEMQIDGLPMSNLIFNPDTDFVYGIPDARIIEPQLLELNEIRTQSMKHRRVDLAKIGIKKDSLTKDAISKLMSESVQAVVEFDIEASIRDSVMPLGNGATGVLQDMAFAAELVRQDIREQAGFSRIQQGEFQGKTHVTASEVRSVLLKSDIRIDERRDDVADLLTNIVRKDLQTVWKFWSTKQVIDIVGPDGAKFWIKYSGPEIQGEYDIQIDPFSDSPETPESKRQAAIEMATAWAQMNAGRIQQGQPVPAEIQRAFFSQFKGVNVEKLLGEQGLPQAQPDIQTPVSPGEAAQLITARRFQQ